jgi:hypothetical protein
VVILAAIFNMVAKNIKNFEVLQLQRKLIFRVF